MKAKTFSWSRGVSLRLGLWQAREILRKHNERYADGHAGGGFLAGPVRPVIAGKRSKVGAKKRI